MGEAFYHCIKGVFLALVILFFGVLVLFPDKTAEKADTILASFEDKGIVFAIQAGKLILGRTKAEVREALSDQKTLDAARHEAACLTDGACDADQQKILFALLKSEVTGSATGSNVTDAAGIPRESWIVIFGSYPTLNGADEAASDLGSRGLSVGVVHMSNRYRPVAIFVDKADAEEQLEAIRGFSGQLESYIRPFASWCNSPKVVKTPKLHYECT